MATKKIAVVYLRCSTEKQDTSVEDQWTFIEKWAKQNGYAIIRKYIDDGISGGSVAKRPGFLQMIADIDKGDFQFVLIWDSFRFARNLVEFLTYKQMLRDNGIKVIAITEPQLDDDNDAQLYIDAMNGASGEMYLRKLSKDVTRGLIQKAERGEYMGKSPFGYEKKPWSEDYLVLDNEVEWVRYMFQSIRDGIQYHEVVKTLRDHEVKTHAGCYFDARAVYRVITNSVYKGIFTAKIKGTIIEDKKAVNIPAIIDEELWDSVNAIIKDRAGKRKKYSKPSRTRKHWLSGRTYCAKCGCAYCYATKTQSHISPRFQCKGYAKGYSCYTSVKVHVVEELVLEKLQDVFNSPAAEYERFITATAPKYDIDFDGEISKVKAALTRAKKAYLADIDTMDEYKENKEKLTAQLDVLEKKKEAANAPAVIDFDNFRIKVVSAISVLQSDAPMEEKMAVSDALIDKVNVDTASKTLDIYFFA